MSDNPPRKLDHIEADVKSHIVCSNLNRVCILHLLNTSPEKEMQAERMAYKLVLMTLFRNRSVWMNCGLVYKPRYGVQVFCRIFSRHVPIR